MTVIDAQVHLNRWGPDWVDAEADQLIDLALAAMDAVGVDAVLVDERAAPDIMHDPDPNASDMGNGVLRFTMPFAERAATLHPTRFAMIARADWRDPDIDSRIAGFARTPGIVATQIAPSLKAEEWQAFIGGNYDRFLAACEAHALPVFVFLAGRVEALPPLLARFPKLTFIVDHWGFPMPSDQPRPGMTHFEKVLALAAYPNVALKWCKGSVFVSSEPYPHRDLVPYMRRALDAFGAERILWASDITQARGRFTWAEALHQIKDCNALDEREKAAVLGQNCQKILRWPL